MAQTERAWHTMTVSEVVTSWDSDVDRGLSPDAVVERRARIGRNELPRPEKPNPLKQLLAQFLNPLVGTLLAAAVVATVIAATEPGTEHRGLAKYSDAIAILLIVVVNAIIGFVQERKAERALEGLQRMSAPRCRVLRAGVSMIIDSVQLVPGDIVDLAEGDQLPADLRLVETASFEAVEGALTGESTAVTKDARVILEPNIVDGDKINMGFMGTTAMRGNARGLVVATGPATRLGRIGDMLNRSEKPKSPLEERLEDFGNKILWLCIAISVALFAIGMVQGGRWHVLLLTAVSVAVAAIPEGLPAITTITLALGMQRMAKHHAIVRKLPAVETLGCVGVICSDKTGTLTLNEMSVRAVWAAGVLYDVTGEGYGGSAKLVHADDRSVVEELPEAVRRVVEIGAVANTTTIAEVAGKLQVAGDPTEAALLALANKIHMPRQSMIEAARTALLVPFDSDRKRMTLVLRRGESHVVHTKGAVERVLPLCSHVRTQAGVVPMDDAMRANIEAQVDTLSRGALRVLAMAEREGGDELIAEGKSDRERADHVEHDLVFAGLIGMIDPPRPEVRTAIAECKRAGIRVVMITGDHVLTATAIAKELGLWEDGDLAMTGEELQTTPEQRLREIVDHVRVFARVSPEHKLRIVRAFQLGRVPHVVAMTGDGVNDAPAIRESSIGVAMGRNGTDVARDAADMVLADDNFATIVEAVREGRAIFSNIKKSIFFLLSSNAGLCVAVFGASFLKDVPPLSPLQILWINLVTNGLPALALGVDPPEADQMGHPPRASGEPFLTQRDWFGILGVGAFMGAVALGIYFLPLWDGATAYETHRSKITLVFTFLALSPLVHAFNCRSDHASIFRQGFFGNRLLLLAVLVSGLIHLLSLVVPPLKPVFRSDHTWTQGEILWTVGLSLLAIPVVELGKLIVGPPKSHVAHAGFGASKTAAPSP